MTNSAAEPSPPYAGLTPDVVLNAVDAVGLVTSGALLALNSYENRVFQIGIDDFGPAAPPGGSRGAAPSGGPAHGAAANDERAGQRGFVVAKFYRPARWSDEQILEEHAFAQELAAHEVPVVAPLVLEGRTLHRHESFRFALYPRRGGRAPNLDDADTLLWLGRFLGRIQAAGAAQPFAHRPALDAESFGVEPRAYLMQSQWLPASLRDVYAGVSQQALDAVRRSYERAGDVRTIRLHGDVHEGNVLWVDEGPQRGPHFVDFDDSRTGPAVQDLWMLLGDRTQRPGRLRDLLEGYEDFAEFDDRELQLVEALRTLRLIHYSAWIARRWSDPAFPAAFPWFDTPRYWEDRILELREQTAAMEEAIEERPR